LDETRGVGDPKEGYFELERGRPAAGHNLATMK
jgi:hypothetical protein